MLGSKVFSIVLKKHEAHHIFQRSHLPVLLHSFLNNQVPDNINVGLREPSFFHYARQLIGVVQLKLASPLQVTWSVHWEAVSRTVPPANVLASCCNL